MTVVAEDKMMGMLTLCYPFILRPAIQFKAITIIINYEVFSMFFHSRVPVVHISQSLL